jgi:hypothetical protein
MAGHRFQGWRVLRLALSTDVDHDDNVLTSQGEYRPIKRCGAAVGKLPLHARAAPPQCAGMSVVVAIPISQPAPQPTR